MKNILLSILVLFSLVIMNSCSGDISGTDTDVKELVIEICEDKIKDGLVYAFILSELQASPSVYNNPTYKQVKYEVEKNLSKLFRPVLDSVDRKMERSNFSLRAIRIIKKEPELKEIECAAELHSRDGNKIDITYTAQKTEDGYLYVEVFGL